ncbi:MAG TPA: TetR/AcrR family transcriptional regulator [Thermoanaerobaculia bacterium]|nr:TetR/AcrR family transcriptional regulator [Thermoanaerobaculia bacterium]
MPATSGPRPRPRHDEELRGRLHDVARALLAEEGPAALSVRRVARLAGTSTSAIYALFGSKDELLRSLCREGSRELGAAIRAVARTADPVADVEAMGRAYRQWALGAPLTYQVLFGGVLADLELEERDRQELRGGLAQLAEAVGRCLAAGRYRRGDPERIAHVLWGLVHGLVGLELTGQIEGDAADLAFEEALQTASRGLAR